MPVIQSILTPGRAHKGLTLEMLGGLRAEDRGSQSLRNFLVGFWPCDEDSGDLIDAHTGGLDVTNYGLTTEPGHVYDTARSRDLNFAIYSERAHAAALSGAGRDFTIACWVNIHSVQFSHALFVGKHSARATAANFEWGLVFQANVTFKFQTSDGTTISSVQATTAGAYDVWRLLIGWHNEITGENSISLDNGTPVVIGSVPTLQDNSEPFTIARAYTERGAMEIGPVMMWQSLPGAGGVLSAAYRETLYNYGAGLQYLDLAEALTPPPEWWFFYNRDAEAVYQPLGADDYEDSLLDLTANDNDIIDLGVKTNLIAFWPGDEASGDLIDAHGSLDLSEVNGPIGNATGKVYATARNYVYASNHRHDSPGADLTLAGKDFTFTAWVYLTQLTDEHVILSRWNTSSAREYMIVADDTDSLWKFMISGNGEGTEYTRVDTPNDSIVLNTWVYLTIWHDTVADTINIQLNNGTVYSASHTYGCYAGTIDFQISDYGGGGGGNSSWPGRIGPVGVWYSDPGDGGVLTAAQRTALYDAGAGLKYEDFGDVPEPSRPTWATLTGWTFDGVDDYLDTGVLPDTTNQEWSMAAQFANGATAGDYCLVGSFSLVGSPAAERFYIFNSISSTVRYGNFSSVNGVAAITEGNLAIAGQSGYKDGVFDAAVVANTGALSGHTIYVGAMNNAGTTTNFNPVDVKALSIYPNTLPPEMATELADRMAVVGVFFKLSSYWIGVELIGDRFDLVGGQRLTASGFPTSAEGHVYDLARLYERLDLDYHSAPDSPALSMAGTDFTILAWVYLFDYDDDAYIIYKGGTNPTDREYDLGFVKSSSLLKFSVKGTTGAAKSVSASSYGAVPLNTWVHVTAWYDDTAQTISIQVDNGAVDSVSHTKGVRENMGNFYMSVNAALNAYWNGMVGPVAMLRHVLTDHERDALWNVGKGRRIRG